MYWENTSTPVAGWSRRSSMAARSPSSVNVGGIRTSTMAASGPCAATAAKGAPAVNRGRDLVPAVFEQPAQALPEQGRVLGDHHPHASDAFTRAAAVRR